MKACYIESYGGLDVMKVGELAEPSLKKGEVLVEVEAASVNPIDWKIRRGDLKFITGGAFPKVLGIDFAGRVKAMGAKSDGFAVGDRVYGPTQVFSRRDGSHAELVSVKAKSLRRIPEGLDTLQAAALPGAALTALNGMRHWPTLSDRRVMVVGASGGVGHFALQIAKARGAFVTAVCSAQNAEFAKELGADQVIDYRAADWTSSVGRHGIVFDAHGGLGFKAALAALEDSGSYVTTLAMPPTLLHAMWRKMVGGRQIAAANMRNHQNDYAEIEELVRSGKVKVAIHSVHPLADAMEAYSASERGGVKGKIVIQIV